MQLCFMQLAAPISFIPPTLKMEIPEFIDVPETQANSSQMEEDVDNTDPSFTKTSQDFDFYDQEKYADGEMDVTFQTANQSEPEHSDSQ